MKRKITFMMLAIALLSIASCKASPMREQVNIDCVLQDSVQAILEKYLPDYGAMDGEVMLLGIKKYMLIMIGILSLSGNDGLVYIRNNINEKL